MWEEMANIRKKYLVAFTKVDSAHLAEPALRRRVYILLVRRPFTRDMFLDSSENCLPKNACVTLIRFARDVALQKLRSHEALEEHCRGIYKELTRELPAPIPVSLVIKENWSLCRWMYIIKMYPIAWNEVWPAAAGRLPVSECYSEGSQGCDCKEEREGRQWRIVWLDKKVLWSHLESNNKHIPMRNTESSPVNFPFHWGPSWRSQSGWKSIGEKCPTLRPTMLASASQFN